MNLTIGFIDKSGFVPADALDVIQINTFMKAAPAASLKDTVDAYLDENLCIPHNKLDFTFNYNGASLTEENLGNLLKKVMKLADTVTVEFDCEFEETFNNAYGGAGDAGYGAPGGGFTWIDPVDVIFTDTATGEEYTVEINFALRKVLCSGEIGWPNGERAKPQS